MSKMLVISLGALAAAGALVALVGARQTPQKEPNYDGFAILKKSPIRADKVVLTNAEWKKKLTAKQYAILRAQGTEAAFCGVFYDNHLTGTYNCAGCGLPLFKSDAKFDSGTGWPSFFQPVEKKNIWLKEDNSYGMHRLEVRCARCDGHLGHVFDDAPQTPTGMRFCINSEALTFAKTP